MFDDEEDIGFVICASCGARIKANRERCLRCEAPLVAWKKPELLPSWLQRWGGGTLIFGVVAVLILLFVVAMFMQSQSHSADDVARSASSVGATRAASAPANATGGAASASAIEPVAFLEAPRRGVVDITGTPASARTRYEEALQKKPADPELLNSLGLLLERLGEVDGAIARFERAAQIEPQNWAYHFNLAHAVSQHQEWDRAVTEYRVAAGLQPADFATQYNLAMALHRKGDDAGAIAEYQKGIDQSPSVPMFHLARGVSLEKVGRTGDAQREYQTYIDMAPSAPAADGVRSHLQALTNRPGS